MKQIAKTIPIMAIMLLIATITAPPAMADSIDPRWEGKKQNPVQDFMKKYTSAYEQRDIEKFISNYSIAAIEDGTLNYGQIASNYEKIFQKGPSTYKLSHVKIDQADGAYTINAQYEVTPQGQSQPAQEGYLRFLLVKEDERLKVMRLDHSATAEQLPTTTSTVGIMAARNTLVQKALQKDVTRDQAKEQYEKEQFTLMLRMLKESPTPIRTDDTIIRVYVLPYTDSSGRLHGSNYTYMKVKDGDWLLGDYMVKAKKTAKQVTTPLENPPESPAQEAAPDKKDTGGQSKPGSPKQPQQPQQQQRSEDGETQMKDQGKKIY